MNSPYRENVNSAASSVPQKSHIFDEDLFHVEVEFLFKGDDCVYTIKHTFKGDEVPSQKEYLQSRYSYSSPVLYNGKNRFYHFLSQSIKDGYYEIEDHFIPCHNLLKAKIINIIPHQVYFTWTEKRV